MAMGRTVVHIDADLEDLIPGYLAHQGEAVGRLRAALAEGDLETVRIAGHSMKGTGGGYGFEAISAIGADLERAAGSGDAGAAATHVERLAEYLAGVEVVYDP